MTGLSSAARTLQVVFAPTGRPVHGGATGMLYGLGDPGIPSGPLIAGARPRTVAQKAPYGLQHPTGDALAVADSYFAAGGSEILIYLQDVYEHWPYEQLGIEDYVERVGQLVKIVATRGDAYRFAWVPFNEPDWIWYGDWAADRERFFADWTAVVHAIRDVLPSARVVGPNDRDYDHERISDFLGWAKTHAVLPDVVAWHELTPESLTTYPDHYADYRALERSLQIDPLPINIDEYGNRRDFSHPANLMQWLAMFEQTKVDADMAYWTYAGNLDDHAVTSTRANGGWWLLKWYADLTGRTADLPLPPPGEGVRAIAALDEDRAQATILYVGTGGDVELRVAGLSRDVFGDALDVAVSRTTWTGYQGDAAQPLAISRDRIALEGEVRVTVPAGDPAAAYRVVLTPHEEDLDPRRAPITARYEAEHAGVTNGIVVAHDDDPQKYATSGGRDVSGLTTVTSAVDFAIEVPDTRDYLLGIFYGTRSVPGAQALFLDETYVADVRYPATLAPTYRGRVDVPVRLVEGRHVVSLRSAGPDGLLSGCDVALDCIDVTARDSSVDTVPAREARLAGGALLRSGSASAPAVVRLDGAHASATFFIVTAEQGYHDLLVDSSGAAGPSIEVNGRSLGYADPGGDGAQVRRVHLGRGVSSVRVTAAGAVDVAAIRLSRVAGESATADVAATDVALTGTASIVESRWAAGGAYVAGLDAGSLSLPRRSRKDAGAYNLTVRYGNGANQGGHEYNTDVVTATVEIAEAGGHRVLGRFGPTHAWDSFQELVVPLDLMTSGGALTISGRGGPAPTIESVSLSPLVLPATL